MDNTVIVSDYSQMDRVLKEERDYILNLCKKVKKIGCNVLLVQKSILRLADDRRYRLIIDLMIFLVTKFTHERREGVSDLALHFLAKMKIMVITDVERDEIEFICKSIGCRPAASVDHFLPEFLGSADLVEECSVGSSKLIKARICSSGIFSTFMPAHSGHWHCQEEPDC